MGNAKHIDGVWALAVALGVGMAVANTPAVALAAPDDSGTSSSSGGSSQSSSSRHSDSTSSDRPSRKNALSTTNDTPNRHRPAPNAPGEVAVNSSGGPHTSTTTGSSASAATTAALTPSPRPLRGGRRAPATPETPGTHDRRSGGATSRPGPAFTSAKTSPNPAAVNAPADDSTPRESGLDATRAAAVRLPSFASHGPLSRRTASPPSRRSHPDRRSGVALCVVSDQRGPVSVRQQRAQRAQRAGAAGSVDTACIRASRIRADLLHPIGDGQPASRSGHQRAGHRHRREHSG